MIAIIIGTAVGTLVAVVTGHYVRQGLRRWLKKQEQK